MFNDKEKKYSFSKSLLNLKFMQKAKQQIEKTHNEETSTENFKNENPNQILNNLETVTYSECCNLMDGRLSFGGMNPKIESLMNTESYNIDQTETKMCDLYSRIQINDKHPPRQKFYKKK